jgi:hypothetical protein
MTTTARHHVHPETNGDPDRLVEEATEMLVVESDPEWRVMIEHLCCDNLIQISSPAYQDALEILNKIEAALISGESCFRPSDGHLIVLDGLRQAWIDESRSTTLISTEPDI